MGISFPDLVQQNSLQLRQSQLSFKDIGGVDQNAFEDEISHTLAGVFHRPLSN